MLILIAFQSLYIHFSLPLKIPETPDLPQPQAQYTVFLPSLTRAIARDFMFPLTPEGRKQYQVERVLVNITALGKVLFFFLARLAFFPGICFQ